MCLLLFIFTRLRNVCDYQEIFKRTNAITFNWIYKKTTLNGARIHTHIQPTLTSDTMICWQFLDINKKAHKQNEKEDIKYMHRKVRCYVSFNIFNIMRDVLTQFLLKTSLETRTKPKHIHSMAIKAMKCFHNTHGTADIYQTNLY